MKYWKATIRYPGPERIIWNVHHSIYAGETESDVVDKVIRDYTHHNGAELMLIEPSSVEAYELQERKKSANTKLLCHLV